MRDAGDLPTPSLDYLTIYLPRGAGEGEGREEQGGAKRAGKDEKSREEERNGEGNHQHRPRRRAGRYRGQRRAGSVPPHGGHSSPRGEVMSLRTRPAGARAGTLRQTQTFRSVRPSKPANTIIPAVTIWMPLTSSTAAAHYCQPISPPALRVGGNGSQPASIKSYSSMPKSAQ